MLIIFGEKKYEELFHSSNFMAKKGSVFAYSTFANVKSLTNNVEQLSPEFFL